MQLSQSLQLTKSSSTKLICSALAIAGITIGISQNRPEAFLIPLGIVSVAAGRIYVNTNKEKDNLRSQVSSLGHDLAYSQEIQQEQKFTLLELQEENTKLKDISLQNKEHRQQKVEYLESLLKSLSSEIQQKKNALLELQEENTTLKDVSLKNDKLIQQLQKQIDSLQETIEYYEEEILDENQTLNEQNKSLKQTVEDLKITQELLLQDQDRLLADIKAISQFDSQAHQTELNSIIDLDQERKKKVDFINLSNSKIAVVGGHPKVQEAIINNLKQEYNLREGIKFTSNDREKRITPQHIKCTLRSCDYIILITGNLSGHIQNTIKLLNSKGHLRGDILAITKSTGESGVLREIKNFLIADKV